MLVEVLAAGSWAYRLGQATFDMIFPLVGALLLGVGIHRRRAFRRWNSSDDDRVIAPQPALEEGDVDDEFDPRLRDDYDPVDEERAPRPAGDFAPRPSQPPGRGTVLIAVGAVVLVFGALNVLATLAGVRADVSGLDVGQCRPGPAAPTVYAPPCSSRAAISPEGH